MSKARQNGNGISSSLRFYEGKTQMEVAQALSGISQAQVSRLEKSALRTHASII